MGRYAPIIDRRAGMTQEEINRILRPNKRRFGQSKLPEPRKYMRLEANKHLHNYRRKHNLRFQQYVDNSGELQTNYGCPHMSDSMRIIQSSGLPFPPLTKGRYRRKKHGQLFKERPQRRTYQQQLEHAFKLLETNFDLMEQHFKHFVLKDLSIPRPQRPSFEVECRDPADFECSHWNRFPQIWMLYLAALRPEHFLESDHIIDLDFSTEAVKPDNPQSASYSLEQYRRRIYSIIHTGYNIYDDTEKIKNFTIVDNVKYYNDTNPSGRDSQYGTSEPYQEEKRPGYLPKNACLQNAGYLADYSADVISQIQKWEEQGVLINLNRNPAYEKALGPYKCELKLTIEPNKPRVCLNARPLASVMKNLPCRLDRLEQLICYLNKDSGVIISDDKQGFLHVGMHQKCRGLMRIHFGDERYVFTSMAFGLTSAPSVYQGCNNVIASLLRQYGIPNVLYIDDRAVVVNDEVDYLGWLVPSLSTSTGHFLSLGKSNLTEKQTVFVYLGIEFDLPREKIRVPEKRKIKIKDLLSDLLSNLNCIPFHSLERLRGKLISILIVCPLAKLYIREMNRVLAEHEAQLSEVIKSDLALEMELRQWQQNPIMLDHENDLHRHGEIDLIPVNGKIDGEYMTDACDYGLGTYCCNTATTIRRQFSIQEGSEMDIGMKEMLAVKMLVQNLDLSSHPTVIRIHVDNMRCVYGYQNYGCRSQYLNGIIKYLFDWQIKNSVRLEMVYVKTDDNLADAPSRFIDLDSELCVTPSLLYQIEQRFRLKFSLDGCASTGTQITCLDGRSLPFCSRYVEDASSYINFFNLPFKKISSETLWIFCPRKREAEFLDHFLAQKFRPKSVFLIIQHAEYPPLLNRLFESSTEFQIYKGRRLLNKPRKKKETFEPYYGHLTLYAYYYPAIKPLPLKFFTVTDHYKLSAP